MRYFKSPNCEIVQLASPTPTLLRDLGISPKSILKWNKLQTHVVLPVAHIKRTWWRLILTRHFESIILSPRITCAWENLMQLISILQVIFLTAIPSAIVYEPQVLGPWREIWSPSQRSHRLGYLCMYNVMISAHQRAVHLSLCGLNAVMSVQRGTIS